MVKANVRAELLRCTTVREGDPRSVLFGQQCVRAPGLQDGRATILQEDPDYFPRAQEIPRQAGKLLTISTKGDIFAQYTI